MKKIFILGMIIVFVSVCFHNYYKKITDIQIDSESLPEYKNEAYSYIHNNKPYFKSSDLKVKEFISYSSLDGLKRCGKASSCLSIKTLSKEKRPSLSVIKPAGWHTYRFDAVKKYESTTSFQSNLGYLYNRCHLIAYELSGDQGDRRNLITGTRYLNVEGMLPFENKVTQYIRKTKHHVLYRVTPIYKGNNLLAHGVLIETQSIEDNNLQFCVYCYNVQPGIKIDYATGKAKEI